jgi:hypothetical protein
MKRKRLPPDDPREWINRAKSNLTHVPAMFCKACICLALSDGPIGTSMDSNGHSGGDGLQCANGGKPVVSTLIPLSRRGGRAADCTGLENRRRRKVFASSHLAPSACLSPACVTIAAGASVARTPGRRPVRAWGPRSRAAGIRRRTGICSWGSSASGPSTAAAP